MTGVAVIEIAVDLNWKMGFLNRAFSGGSKISGRNVPKTSPLQHIHDLMAKRDSKIVYAAPAVKPAGNGDSPSGTMEIKFNQNFICPGFEEQGNVARAIRIDYDIPAGVQFNYHPHPGVSFDGTRRRAYLPDTAEGRCLLNRFKYAFVHGHMFGIGRSQTSNRENVVCWTTIPNKTSLQGGEFGFPDKAYLEKSHFALDQLGIPDSDDCLNTANSNNRDADNSLIQTFACTFPVHNKLISYQAPTCLSLSETDLHAALEPYIPTDSKLPKPIPAPTLLSDPSSGKPIVSAIPLSTHPNSQSSILSFASASSSPNAMLQAAPPSAQASATGPNLRPANIITASQVIDSAYSPPPPVTSETASTHAVHELDCAICLDFLSSTSSTEKPCVRLKDCRHAFHKHCIVDCLKQVPNCPVCRQAIGGRTQGKSPSGTMRINVDQTRACPGFPQSPGSITIEYNIPGGIQAKYNENPGVGYNGTIRTAYLPNTTEGRQLLYRLVYAFKSGLIFRVGTSLTTHRPNQVTWTSIHHKTSLHGGTHGFPDANYISNCNASLDALNVPDPQGCVLQKLNV